jgi:hypothetical protein
MARFHAITTPLVSIAKVASGRKGDDIRFPALMVPDAHFRLPLQDGLLDSVRKLGELR